jgi:hypothetical protein
MEGVLKVPRTRSEKENDAKDKLAGQFSRIKTSTTILILDPLFMKCCCCFNFFCCKAVKRQRRQLAEVEGKFVAELDAKKILNKVGDSYEVVKHMVSKKYFEMLKFNR